MCKLFNPIFTFFTYTGKVKVVKLSADMRAPLKYTIGAAGWDLFAAEDVSIPPRGRKEISHGIKLEIPAGTYGRIAIRSLLAGHGLQTAGGVINSDYRGTIKSHIFNTNTGPDPYQIHKGQRITQIIFETLADVEMEVTSEKFLSKTNRGQGTLGSTGK
jgi:dUTP pyrophosphatase